MACAFMASHQQYGKESTGENVEGEAEAGPPHWDTWILNEEAMKKVKNSVSSEGSHNQPKVLLEACHDQGKNSACTFDRNAAQPSRISRKPKPMGLRVYG